MSELDSLAVDIREHVAWVELIGPGKGNAMGPAFWDELPTVMRSLDEDPNVRVVVLSGRGRSFSVGLDLMAMMSELGPLIQGPQLADGRAKLRRLIDRMQAATTSVEACRKPVIAAVDGWCIGGAMDLITACDIRLCTEQAVFSVREVKVAIVADLGTLQRLPRIVGEGTAREWALTGMDVGADRALATGLVNRVLADRDGLFAEVSALAAEIAANPPLVVQGTKQVMNWSRDRSVEDGLAYVASHNAAMLQSNDLTEAFMAFMEKRAPDFTGS